MELEKTIREFQQVQQDFLFSRIASITQSMRSFCDKVVQAEPPGPDRAPGAGRAGAGAAGCLTPAGEEDPDGGALDAETQRALRRRLQSLGDVVVYSSPKYEACSASGRPIPPGSLRVRPRRCDHVFLLECLMPYWAEGLCPVCRCSFALDRPSARAGRVGEADDGEDRCSVLSASASQVGSLAPPRLQRSASRGAGSDADLGGRPAAASRSPCGRASPPPAARARSATSPARSVASALSHGSSAPRDQPAAVARQRSTRSTGRPL